MIRGDIDLTKDLDFYHDNSEKLRTITVSGCCPWELNTESISTITLTNNSYLISNQNQVVEYNDTPDVDLDEDTFRRSYLSTSTESSMQSIQTTYYDDNIVTTISYDDRVYTRDQFTNYYLTYNNFDNSSITILNNSSSNSNKYTLKWNASTKLDYESDIDCFGYHKRKKTYRSFPNSDVLDEFEDKPEKYYPKIPWDNNSLSFSFNYFQHDYSIHCILPWDNRDRKNETKKYYHGIPWLDKLNRWVREDYIDELDGYEKDNSKFLTDMRWFHTSRNRI